MKRLKAQKFRRTLATVKKPAVACLGVTTVLVLHGREVALFAPDTETLKHFWDKVSGGYAFDKKYIQRTSFFRQTKLTSRKRLPVNGRAEP